MKDDGEVERSVVIDILNKSQASAGFSVSVSGSYVTLEMDGIIESHHLPERVTRKLLQRFCNKFGAKIEHFYHPEMVA